MCTKKICAMVKHGDFSRGRDGEKNDKHPDFYQQQSRYFMGLLG
jgi:hypothetical protein